MRTLATQVRLRRLIRGHAEYLSRLRIDPADRDLAGSAGSRLRQLTGDVRTAWAQDCSQESPADELTAVRRHLSRSLSAMEAAVTGLEMACADLGRLGIEFQDVALPLMFFLRGLEELPQRRLSEWLAPPALSRSA